VRHVDDGSPVVPGRNDRRLAFAFIAPALMIASIFVIVPFVSSTRLAFFNVDRFGHVGRYVGWANIRRVLGEPQLRASLVATAKFVLLVSPASVMLGLVLAVAAYRPMRGIAWFRVIFSSTVATGGAVSAALFVVLFAPTTGALRYALQLLGFLGRDQTISALNDNRWAIVAVATVTVWSGLGFSFIIFSAALQGVPEVLFESAAIDGCGAWKTFRHITVPSIRPMIGFMLVASSLNAVLTFGQIDVLTKGGPAHHTDVLAYSLYVASFRDGDQSKGAVYSVVLLAVCLALGACQVIVLRRRRDTDDV
jgi:sn-glycerol 3-phosphate transport system permease protein